MIQILITVAFVATIYAFVLQLKDMIAECKEFFFVPDDDNCKSESEVST